MSSFQKGKSVIGNLSLVFETIPNANGLLIVDPSGNLPKRKSSSKAKKPKKVFEEILIFFFKIHSELLINQNYFLSGCT
jgi:hypothetical protein